ncbi:aspartyl-phosphate phosphatase Spo0E family protein [Senegalia massiliensis]|uniref:aspartyl-phosphate phosphatase Spo0E family protein n=1 Tax=Senegalia massiliensis TaxID=1720316 RepID=UPI001F5EA684|nr:aspartyl-phosphate phosphatase Spo0E family protein [Senegalia massiliensis]
MENLESIEEKIELLRNQMHNLLHKNSSLNIKEIVDISQELDEILNLYYKIKKDQDY